jgi:hypothetical protein
LRWLGRRNRDFDIATRMADLLRFPQQVQTSFASGQSTVIKLVRKRDHPQYDYRKETKK